MQDEGRHAPSATLTAGVELAESAMRIAVTLSGEAGARHLQRRLSAPPTPDDAVEEVAVLIAHAAAETAGTPAAERGQGLRAAGVALWGDVDGHAGVVRRLPPLVEWEGYPLAERLAQRLTAAGEPTVTIVSGAQARALAEAWGGAAAATPTLLYVHLGRVVSSGYVSHGRVLTGAHGNAGNLAHVAVRADGPRCACGGRGHLDALASAQAIVRTVIGRAADSEASTKAMLRISGGRAEAMTAAQVLQLAHEGVPEAREVVGDVIAALAVALAQAVALLDPDLIILDGALGADKGQSLDVLQLELNRLCGARTPAPPIQAATWPRNGALLGAWLVGERGAKALG